MEPIEREWHELKKYVHPLLEFSWHETRNGFEIFANLKKVAKSSRIAFRQSCSRGNANHVTAHCGTPHSLRRLLWLDFVALVWCCSAVVLAQGQSPEWESLLNQGVTAENSGDYGKSLGFFSDSCRPGSQSDASQARRTACLKLAEAHAIQGQLGKSSEVLKELLNSLRTDRLASPMDLAETLLMQAEVEGARGRLDSAVESLREALTPIRSLPPSQAGRALARMGQFYLAAGQNIIGGRLLDNALAQIRSKPDLEDATYIESATSIASVLRWYGRTPEARELLDPVAPRAKRDFVEGRELSSQLRDGLMAAVQEYCYGLERPDAGGWETLLQKWKEQTAGSNDPQPVADDQLRDPELLKRREPTYTPGARNAGVEGTVVLTVEVWPDGRAHKIRVLRPLPFGLSWSAIRAVRAWRFRASTRMGQPVKRAATIEVNFHRFQ